MLAKSLPSPFSEKDRLASSGVLNRILSDEVVLYTKTRNYHWNVTGPEFSELHRFLDEQYNQLNAIVDDVAERVRSIGGRPAGSLAAFLKLSRLKEGSEEPLSALHMVGDLLRGHEALIEHLRADLTEVLDRHHDGGTNNFRTDLLERHEKMAWMRRAHLGEGYR